MRIRLLPSILCLATLFIVASATAAPPNIVFILADDLGWADLGCYGSAFHETPNLDRLAQNGMRFTNGYAACHVCSPTRASIMTGKYPARLQLTNFLKGLRQPDDSPLLTAKYRDALPLEEITLAEALMPAGYVSGMFGKWHLGGQVSPKLPNFGPKHQGFDISHEIAASGPPPGKKTSKPDKNGEWLTDRAIEFIEAQRQRPFFCYLAYHAVHIPLEADAKLIEKYRNKAASGPQKNVLYAAMVEELDLHVGRLLQKLDELKLADNTLVVFTSDNGGLSVAEGPNTPATSNAPFRVGKGHLYEGGIRVPWIVRWPGRVKPGVTCSVSVCSVDWFPTFVEVSGVDHSPQDIDGISIVPLLKGNDTLPSRDLFWHYPHFANQGGRPAAAIRSGDWKLIESYETGEVELYDLAADPGENHDLSKSKPELAKKLHDKLVAWREQVNANMPERRNARATD